MARHHAAGRHDRAVPDRDIREDYCVRSDEHVVLDPHRDFVRLEGLACPPVDAPVLEVRDDRDADADRDALPDHDASWEAGLDHRAEAEPRPLADLDAALPLQPGTYGVASGRMQRDRLQDTSRYVGNERTTHGLTVGRIGSRAQPPTPPQDAG